MSSQAWSTSQTPIPAPGSEADTSTTALDLLAALAVSPVRFYHFFQLNLGQPLVQRAGRGGNAVVEIGTTNTPEKSLVAVKRSRVPPNLSSDDTKEGIFTPHFEQLTRELRILGNSKMRKHPNIVDVLGVCFENERRTPALYLVLEYSPHGNLRDFLCQQEPKTSAAQRSAFILHVANGLEALHGLKICHGDVKIENTLIFSSDEGWKVKLSDFGQSILTNSDAQNQNVLRPVGTALLEAPEIRDCGTEEATAFSIDDALLTDIFSFGLLAWEVVKHGQRYFESTWINPASGHIDSIAMEEYLNSLPQNGLLTRAIEFLEGSGVEADIRSQASLVIECCLQDVPGRRQCMARIIEILEAGTFPTARRDERPESETSLDMFDLLASLESNIVSDKIVSWNMMSSLYDLLFYSQVIVEGGELLKHLPMALQHRILLELQNLVLSEQKSQNFQAHAAMTVSECYTVGFGGTTDTAQAVHWLGIAASRGCEKARAYYHRVCAATGTEPEESLKAQESWATEKFLESVDPDLYLIERIHYFNKRTILEARIIADQQQSLKKEPVCCSTSIVALSLFNDKHIDKLLPLHVASLLGDDDSVRSLLKYAAKDAKTELGLNAVHLACLGGNLSTLRILLDAGVPVLSADFEKITPLHLSVFFRPEDLAVVIGLLQDRENCLDISTQGTLVWSAHDIDIRGTPLNWAIELRYRAMVQILLPRYPVADDNWLFQSIKNFYPEILEDMYPFFRDNQNLPTDLIRPHTVIKPFEHWIRHGSRHSSDIYETIRRCCDYGFIGFHTDGVPYLQDLISSAGTEDSLVVIEAILAISAPSYVKHTVTWLGMRPAIVTAFESAGSNTAWKTVVEQLASFYTLSELESEGFLLDAIEHRSMIACQVLLERGVDVNKYYTHTKMIIETPIHKCVTGPESAEVLSLLVEHGANVLVKDPIFHRTALERLLCGHMQRDEILKILLKCELPGAVYAATLHEILNMQLIRLIRRLKTGRTDPYIQDEGRDYLRTLLRHPQFVPYIDTPEENGTTLIQKAATFLNADCVRLLLEAGADASIPYKTATCSGMPLQLACAHARLIGVRDFMSTDYLKRIDGWHDVEDVVCNPIRRAQAMEVASELLKWHVARGDGHFKGITELHLAYRMMFGDEIQRIANNAGDRLDVNAVGCWPGVEVMVTPKKLGGMKNLTEDGIVGQFPRFEYLPGEPLEEYMEMSNALAKPEEDDSIPSFIEKGIKDQLT